MMVPRSFVPMSTAKRQSIDMNEKASMLTSRRLSQQAAAFEAGPSPPRSRSRSPTNTSTQANPRSDPVTIPTQRKRRPTPTTARPSLATSSVSQPSLSNNVLISEPRRIGSARDLLTATTIPARKRPRGRRLPAGDHVAEFSRLLLDDVKPGIDGSLSGSLSNPNFDGLFGNLDELVEGQMFVGSEGVDASILSTRSVSSESMPSLGSSEDFVLTDLSGFSPTQRNASERKLRLLASSQGCDDDHPLLYPPELDSPISSSPEMNTPRNLSPTRRGVPATDRTSTFKSSLSASLRALRSAAQSVSNIATSPPLIQPDDCLTHSFFKIQPALTDDKRPPPSSDVPSPELRRYLNPNTLPTPPDSPAQLHFWHDERPSRASSLSRMPSRKSKHNPKSRSPSPPRSIPLQSCIPPTIRTANASAPPIWLSADGNPSNKRTVGHNLPQAISGPGVVKQREPRENPDFLRVLVAEMNMRRAGKFEADAAGRARMWVEARGGSMETRKKAEDRWEVWRADDSGTANEALPGSMQKNGTEISIEQISSSV